MLEIHARRAALGNIRRRLETRLLTINREPETLGECIRAMRVVDTLLDSTLWAVPRGEF